MWEKERHARQHDILYVLIKIIRRDFIAECSACMTVKFWPSLYCDQIWKGLVLLNVFTLYIDLEVQL